MFQNKIDKVLVVLPVEDRHRKLLRSSAQGAQMEFIPAKDLTRQQVQDADIIIGNVSPELLRGT